MIQLLSQTYNAKIDVVTNKICLHHFPLLLSIFICFGRELCSGWLADAILSTFGIVLNDNGCDFFRISIRIA